MDLLTTYSEAKREEDIARLRRAIALRAMAANGYSQSRIASALGISQPAVSQQLKHGPDLEALHPEMLLAAASPVLNALAAENGYTRLAVFGSVARQEARKDSDIDLLVEAPAGTSTFDFLRFKRKIEETLGREVDLVSYGGLKPGLDDDIALGAVLLA